MKKKEKKTKLRERSIQKKEKNTAVKDAGDNVKLGGKIHLFSSIRVKLTLAFLMPVVLFTIVGILIYNSAHLHWFRIARIPLILQFPL